MGRGGARPGAGRKPNAAKASEKVRAAKAPAEIYQKRDTDELFRSLPLRQQNFIVNYLVTGKDRFNATKAAIDAGFSKRTADSQGSRLLKNAKVKAVIAARAEKSLTKREITAERVLDEIAKLAFLDPRRMFALDGSLLPIAELGDDEAGSLAGIEVIEIMVGRGKKRKAVGSLKKIKLADKGLNLERLGRYLKLFTDKVEHTGEVKIQRILMPAKPAAPVKKDVSPDFG